MARDYGYIISPSLSWYNFKNGQTIKDQFTFTNSFITDEPESQDFVVSVKFVFQDKGEKIIYDTPPKGFENYDLSKWVTVKKTAFTLKKGESIKIPFEINVPTQPDPGGKYSAIVITKGSTTKLDSSGAALADKIAYQLLGSVAGTEIRDSEVLDFKVNKPIFWWWPNEQADFTVSVKNKGNVALLPSGDIFVHKGDITQSIWNSAFNSNELVILPQNSRDYTVSWKPTGPFLKTTQNGLTINLDYVRVGKYVTTAKIGYDQNGKRIITDRLVSFWILPIPLIIAILTLTLVILGWILWQKRKNRK